MTATRLFGEIADIPPGTAFPSRQALHDAGVHLPTQAGISGSAQEGADSVVISGGYENDEDYGDYIVYTGEGGRDEGSTKITSDQVFGGRNEALAVSWRDGLPVRVIRGAGGDPRYSPASGFRYDGLFFVERYWEERIPYRIYRYRLLRPELQSPAAAIPSGDIPTGPTRRVKETRHRIVRNFRLAEQVRRAFDYECQICGTRINTPAGPYAEVAHIRPLGRPHDGPDTTSNVLCLCPNDHIRLDAGAIWIDDSYRIHDSQTGSLMGLMLTQRNYKPAEEHLRYHREHIVSRVQAEPPGE